MTNPDLDSAYALDGPESARTLYKSWAQSYDQSFGRDLGYVAPREVAAIFRELSGDDTPVLDVGAGTGLLVEHLPNHTVDAIDLSPEMLAVAKTKGLYRNLICGDLLQPLDLPDDAYGAIVSSGTFTHGHVGPDCLPELLRIARPGALFVCGCRPDVFDGMGFGSTLARMNAAGQVSTLCFREIPIYADATHDHADDRGLVMVFRKS